MLMPKFLHRTLYQKISNQRRTIINLANQHRSIQIKPILGGKNNSTSTVNPLQHEDYFGVKNLVTLEDLFNARVHYGHKKGCRNNNMQPYLFGCRNEIDVIDLDVTLEHLLHAMNFLSHIVYVGGIVLFFMHSHIHGHAVEKMAHDCGEFALTRLYHRSSFLTPIEHSAKLPDLIVFLSLMNNVNQQHVCITDCAKINIPTIGIADTNSDPSLITYPVPGNDDTHQSIELYLKLFKTCVNNAKQRRKEDGLDELDITKE